jgi:hypothetical protein
MVKADSTAAWQVVLPAVAFPQQRTGHAPGSVAAAPGGDALHGAVSPAEKRLAQSPAGPRGRP